MFNVNVFFTNAAGTIFSDDGYFMREDGHSMDERT